MIKNILTYFPCDKLLEDYNDVSENQRKATYDIIMRAITYKYIYETKKMQGINCPDKNLNDFKVYNKILNDENFKKVYDRITLDYLYDTLAKIRGNDFSKQSTINTYESIIKWFHPQNYLGKLFRDNLMHNKDYTKAYFINFREIFKNCDKQEISENTPAFSEVKKLYKTLENNTEKYF